LAYVEKEDRCSWRSKRLEYRGKERVDIAVARDQGKSAGSVG